MLRLFDRRVADLEAFCGDQDLIYVSGGNTAILLAAWRTHGLDRALRTAADAGVVMAGMSAGANCWFEASTTDSFLMGSADALTDGLGFVPGSFTPRCLRPSVPRLPAQYGAANRHSRSAQMCRCILMWITLSI